MENKGLRSCLLAFALIALLVVTFFGGFVIGSIMPRNPLREALGLGYTPTDIVNPIQPTKDVSSGDVSPTQIVQATTPEELDELFKPFWESWDLLHKNYVDQPLDDLTLMRGAIQGMLAATGDKHTSYMDPQQFQQANAEMEGEYTGIGAWVDTSGEYVEVISPMKGSPAEAAGLRAKDLVIAINGEDMTGVPGDLALKKILGPAGEP